MHGAVPHILLLALIDGRHDRSGGARHVCGAAEALRRRGARVTLLTATGVADSIATCCDRVVVAAPPHRPILWRLSAWLRPAFWERTVADAARNADAVVALSPELGAAAARLRRHVPLVYAPAMLASLEQVGGAGRLLERLERAALDGADAVVLTTPAVRDAIEHVLGRPLPNVRLAPLGTQHVVGPATRLRPALGVPDTARILLTVGALNANKGQRLIARALRHAAPDAWWIVIGDGPDRAALEAELAGGGAAGRTRLLTDDMQIADWYRTADVLVSASRVETFGLATAEALALGCPAIVPMNGIGDVVSPLAGWIDEHDAGTGFRRGDDASLLRAVERVLTGPACDPAARERIALAAQTDFDWDRYAGALLDAAGLTTRAVEPRAPLAAGASARRLAP